MVLERDGKMDAQLDGSPGEQVSRLEVLEGPSGRRHRSKGERVRIALESMMPGASVTAVARKHDVTRWQVYDWRRQVKDGRLTVPEDMAALPAFAKLVVEPEERPASAPAPDERIEVVVGDIVVRARAGTDQEHLVRVLRAARVAAT